MTYEYDYLNAIEKEKSMTKAAKSLGISQPALSAWLTKLESKLGYEIINRKSSPICITPKGSFYLEYIKECRKLENECIAKIKDYDSSGMTQVRIGAPEAYFYSLIIDAIKKCEAGGKDYSVSTKVGSLSKLIESIEKQEVDMIISTTSELPAGFESEILMQDSVVLCVPKSNSINDKLNEKGVITNLSILNNQDFIMLEEKQPLQIIVNDYLKKMEIKVKNSIIVDQVVSAVRLVSEGLGICFAEESLLDHIGEMKDKLCVYRLEDSSFERNVYLAWSNNRYLSKSNLLMKEVLKEIVDEKGIC